jgi:heme/copper-type cytochrome/quinol oxidase subunit 2
MNLINIIYEPYFIIILISLIITIISYFILKKNKNNNEEDKTNIPLTLFYIFIISFILLIGGKYAVDYMNKNNYFQKGGLVNTSDKLTIIDDDIDVGLYEE